MRGNDKIGGLLFVAVGLLACLYSAATLDIGTAIRMGPGYFPFVLGLILIGLGALIALRGLVRPAGGFGRLPWRSIALIAAAPLAFALTVEGLGLVLSTALAGLLASLASPGIPLVRRLVMVALLTALTLLVFAAGLHVAVPLLGTWLV